MLNKTTEQDLNYPRSKAKIKQTSQKYCTVLNATAIITLCQHQQVFLYTVILLLNSRCTNYPTRQKETTVSTESMLNYLRLKVRILLSNYRKS